MGTRDALPGEPESVGAIWASDHFIEQLQANGTYEPTSRTDAALAAALVAWRDDVREDAISPPPLADDVVIEPRPTIQPRRIARRAVAVAGVLLAMSSAMATALDADPLKPVRYLVDLGVTVGERITDPVNDPSAEEAPSSPVGEGDTEGEWSSADGVMPVGPPVGDIRPNPDAKPSLPADSRATQSEAEEIVPTTDPTAEPTDTSGGTDAESDTSASDPSAQPTESEETEEPATSDPTSDPTTDPTTDSTTEPTSESTSEPTGTSSGTAPPAEGDSEGADTGGDSANSQDQPASTIEGHDAAISDGGNVPGVADPNDSTSDQASGEGAYSEDAYGDSSDHNAYGDGESYSDDAPDSDGNAYSAADGDSQVDAGGESDSTAPLGPSALPNVSPPYDLKEWRAIYRHEYATHGQGHARHDGTMGWPAKIHPHRGDAWKSQVLMFLTRSPRSD